MNEEAYKRMVKTAIEKRQKDEKHRKKVIRTLDKLSRQKAPPQPCPKPSKKILPRPQIHQKAAVPVQKEKIKSKPRTKVSRK